MKFDQLCTVISLVHCTGMHVLALYFSSYSVSECYVQRNDVLCHLKCITGGWSNTTFVTLSKLFHSRNHPCTNILDLQPIHPT